jgi:acetate kinase
MKVLVLNSGSSSQKSSLYQMDETLPDDPPTSLWQGKIEWRDKVAEAEIKNARGVVQKNRAKVSSRAEAVEHLLGTLTDGDRSAVTSLTQIDVVGHRVVHGGPKYEEPVSLTPEVRAGIAKASAFAPLHNRAELEGMEIIQKLLGRVPQVAVFDTGFHRKMPQAASVYPGALSVVQARHPPLRISRDQSSILRNTRCEASRPRPKLTQISYLPFRERLLSGRNS